MKHLFAGVVVKRRLNISLLGVKEMHRQSREVNVEDYPPYEKRGKVQVEGVEGSREV